MLGTGLMSEVNLESICKARLSVIIIYPFVTFSLSFSSSSILLSIKVLVMVRRELLSEKPFVT